MATTAIWDVRGWLGKVVIYVENPDKTDNPAFYGNPDMTDKEREGLSDVISYAVNSNKTTEAHGEDAMLKRNFVSGIGCFPSTAREEMLAVKRRYGKDGGIVAFHGYQSFAPGEATPELAHQIGVRMAQELWGDRFQVIVATHLDKANHLHNHFVINSVSFLDGKRYNDCTATYMEMRKKSDELCREYGLSVIENPRRGKAKQYGEWKADNEGRPTWRGLIRADIDEAIRQSMSERQFFEKLRQKGYEVKIGKDISVRPQGKERFVRLMRNFGDEYSIEAIRKRILRQALPEVAKPIHQNTKQYRVRGNIKRTRKITGFRALYFHYCYKLGIFPKDRPQNRARLHFLLREDLMKLNNISQEVRLLVRHRIDTAEQLSLYKQGLEVDIERTVSERNELYRLKRTKAVRDNPDKAAELEEQISALSGKLKGLRREVHLCDDIEERSGIMKEKLKTVREDEQQGKEKSTNEHIRRRR